MKLLEKYTRVNNDQSVKVPSAAENRIDEIGNGPGDLLPEILVISSYPPRECGIATYTDDLISAIDEKFSRSFSVKVCALETEDTSYKYPSHVKYVLNTSDPDAYERLAEQLNLDTNISVILLQHEFGLFGGEQGRNLLSLLCLLKKPVITTFHTVIPAPDALQEKVIQNIVSNSAFVVVMTHDSARILESDYGVSPLKISVIPHGTHLSSSIDDPQKARRHRLGNRAVFSTFGLLSAGKGIETALDALPAIIEKFPSVLYLIIGKTHPHVLKREGEQYREMLQQKVVDLGLGNHVRFINQYLPLPLLLEYLVRTDIYLFTSKDPHQAVSGTFAYAMGCGCPIISTPIPHAKEMLMGAGMIIDFQRPDLLAEAAIKLLSDPVLLHDMKLNALHKIRPTAWPNAALAHIALARTVLRDQAPELLYNLPPISLAHLQRLTTPDGLVQFSKLSVPDLESGYTLDDNARALIVICKHYRLTQASSDLALIKIYLNFILRCQQPGGDFLNYVDEDGTFNPRNHHENLEDANGRAVWALGEFMEYENLLDDGWIKKAEVSLLLALPSVIKLHSPRAISFAIKGLYAYHLARGNKEVSQLITSLADNLVEKYICVSDKKWKWFEEYLTYANSVMPEAVLCAYRCTGALIYKRVAKSGFDFLLKLIFNGDQIRVISNQGSFRKGEPSVKYGEQPIDVAYTILALDRFRAVFHDENYLSKMETAFNWFLGKNHLRQIIYSPVTGGCCDGLEESHVNLNQGAESTMSYLLARLTLEKIPALSRAFSRMPIQFNLADYQYSLPA